MKVIDTEYQISVKKYLELGANLNNLDIDKTICDYFDKNRDKKITQIKNKGETNKSGVPLLWLKYEDGTENRYSSEWIKTKVKILMDNKYF